MTDHLTASLDTLFEHYRKSFEQLVIEHDPQWPSPAEVGQPWEDESGRSLVQWQPVVRHPEADDFAAIERALDITIHPDIKTYFGRYWSANLDMLAPDGYVNLLFLWNQQDVDRLTENLIGHAVACRHNRTPFSVFFACTEEDSELYLTVNNDTGEVMLEQPARAPLRTVSPSLAEFLDRLVPAPVATKSAV